jgi:Domain of unknown function (DUF4407)
MTEQTERPPQASPRGLGMWLRRLAGVDETIIGWVPTERARYAALGGVILGTATIATLSMFVALSESFGRPRPVLLLPAVVWGLFVLNLDRWLVSSSTGSDWVQRLRLLLPRLLLAMFLGVVIAEPLVLRIFQTAVEQHIGDARDAAVRDLQGNLLTCNPVPDQNPRADRYAAGRQCDDYRLPTDESPAGDAATLARLRRDTSTLQGSIDKDEATQRGLDDLAVKECAGASGPGLTGRAGEGPECRNRRSAAAVFRANHPSAARLAQLGRMRAQVAALESSTATSTTGFESERSRAIATKIKDLRDHQGPIGLLERLGALSDLVHGNAFLGAAVWAVRGLIIIVDCLPVLVKLLGGTSSYDRLVQRRQEGTERIHAEAGRIIERTVLIGLELDQHEAQSTARNRRDDIDVAEREHMASVNTKLDAAVEALAAELRQRGPTTARLNGTTSVYNGATSVRT